MEIDVRKISATGSGSLMLCIPRWWCRTHGLKNGSFLSISLETDQALRLMPKKDEEGETKRK